MNIQDDFDVLVIGAGLSGIGTACQIQAEFPLKRIAIIERRQSIGGTWDLFRYPGIRSDSDMLTFGYKFHPWRGLKTLADGESIKNYIRSTARQFGVEDKIHYGLKTTEANWDSKARRWLVSAIEEATGQIKVFSGKFMASCTGYYNHDAGFLPEFPGRDQFKGQFIHPQHWPENLDYSDKKVVVIGSGATAVTLVPAIARKSKHVTMLQRSPSYVFSLPTYDKITGMLLKVMPENWAFGLARKRNILITRWLYLACRKWPELMRKFLLNHVKSKLGDKVDMRHFTPKYMPWDERLCAVPDADLFTVLREGKASVETDQIDTFVENGLRLKSGKVLQADIVVAATGLNIQMLGGMELKYDNQPRHLNELMTYKGVMIESLPNMAWIFGYTNAPWTLKSDLAAGYLIRLLRHMDQNQIDVAKPVDMEQSKLAEGMLDSLQSGYVQRANHMLPRQGRKFPWQVEMHYERDTETLLQKPIADGILCFEKA